MVVHLFNVPVAIGGVVGVEVRTRLGRMNHRGIVSDSYGSDGQPTVIHASNLVGQVVEEEATAFMRKAVGPVRFVGYWGNLPPHEVLRRARGQIGQKYRLFTANCEHFATGVHGLAPTSPQLRDTAGTAVLTTTMAATGLLAAIGLAK